MTIFFGWRLLVFGLCLTLLGCGQSRKLVQKPVSTVSGTILVDGKPAVGAVVCFHPQGEPKGLRAAGKVGGDGKVALTTYGKSDGAPPGEYIVTVYWAGNVAKSISKNDEDEDEVTSELLPDRLNGRYLTPEKSNLRARVGDKPVEFEPLDLSSTAVVKAREFQLRIR